MPAIHSYTQLITHYTEDLAGISATSNSHIRYNSDTDTTYTHNKLKGHGSSPENLESRAEKKRAGAQHIKDLIADHFRDHITAKNITAFTAEDVAESIFSKVGHDFDVDLNDGVKKIHLLEIDQHVRDMEARTDMPRRPFNKYRRAQDSITAFGHSVGVGASNLWNSRQIKAAVAVKDIIQNVVPDLANATSGTKLRSGDYENFPRDLVTIMLSQSSTDHMGYKANSDSFGYFASSVILRDALERGEFTEDDINLLNTAAQLNFATYKGGPEFVGLPTDLSGRKMNDDTMNLVANFLYKVYLDESDNGFREINVGGDFRLQMATDFRDEANGEAKLSYFLTRPLEVESREGDGLSFDPASFASCLNLGAEGATRSLLQSVINDPRSHPS